MLRPLIPAAAAVCLLAGTAAANDQTNDLTSWLQDRQAAMTDALNRDLLSGGPSQQAQASAPARTLYGAIRVIPVSTVRSGEELRPAVKTNKI